MGSLEEGRIDFRPLLRGKRVFLTGHTGFKGSWLALWLSRLGAQVAGYSLQPPTQPNNFEVSQVQRHIARHMIGDVRDARHLKQALWETAPEVVFHLAAQPIVRAGYRQPHATFDINVMGTVNLLDALRQLGHSCAVVIVTTDKCYENRGELWGFRECDPVGGQDPYSASKAASELATASYRDSYFHPSKLGRHGIQLATARAGNVIGGGDWASDRIVVDIVKSLVAEVPVQLRNPQATRPWQHVLEPLGGYCQLAGAMLGDPHPRWCSAWNFGPRPGKARSVLELTQAIIRHWGRGQWIDASDATQPHEASVLQLCIDKANTLLDWMPCWEFERTVQATAQWYRAYYDQPASDMNACCMADVEAYQRDAFKAADQIGCPSDQLVAPHQARRTVEDSRTIRRAG
jgi:CDP-glucose 4,6-dehydratase